MMEYYCDDLFFQVAVAAEQAAEDILREDELLRAAGFEYFDAYDDVGELRPEYRAGLRRENLQ